MTIRSLFACHVCACMPFTVDHTTFSRSARVGISLWFTILRSSSIRFHGRWSRGPGRRGWQGCRLPPERFWGYTKRAAEADARLCRGATAPAIGCTGDRWSPGADSLESVPSLGCPRRYIGCSMPEKYLGGFGRQSPSSGWQDCGRRPLTSEVRVSRSPAPCGALAGICPLLVRSESTPARPGPKTIPMKLRTASLRVHKLTGFVYGDCRLRRDKHGDSYLGIDLLRLRPSGTWLRPLGDVPLPVRAGVRPADSVSLRHASRGLPALRHAQGRELAVGRRQAVLDKGLRRGSGQLAKCLSSYETARIFETSLDTVHRAAGIAVDWDRAPISLDGVTALRVDEIAGRLASAT